MVIDFGVSAREDGFARREDLTTKWRLTKATNSGISRIDTTPPHHVSDDCLSELGACVALARRTPRSTLARVVRANVVARNTGISAIARRLQTRRPSIFTPTRVFSSIHEDMDDLGVPSWCAIDGDAVAYFIKIHREARALAVRKPRVDRFNVRTRDVR